jgi:hypothetical protein
MILLRLLVVLVVGIFVVIFLIGRFLFRGFLFVGGDQVHASQREGQAQANAQQILHIQSFPGLYPVPLLIRKAGLRGLLEGLIGPGCELIITLSLIFSIS